MQSDQSVPPELKKHLEQSEQICHSFLFGLKFILDDTERDPSFFTNHLLSYMFQDYLQSTVSLPILIHEGIHNISRRELRFILEMSIKICYVQQNQYESDVETKLLTYKSIIDSTNISIQKNLSLNFIPEPEIPSFYQEVGYLYGATSNYVHLTTTQIRERIALVEQGHTSGFEGPDEIISLNNLMGHILGCSLVFLLHSVPAHVAGDLLVQTDGSSLDWFFAHSKFIALIDEHFDYKHERIKNLTEIKKMRWANVTM